MMIKLVELIQILWSMQNIKKELLDLINKAEVCCNRRKEENTIKREHKNIELISSKNIRAKC